MAMISKLVDAVNQMSTWRFMNIRGQGHAFTLVQGHSGSTFSNFFSLETARSIESKFLVDPLCDREMKVSTNNLSHDQDGRHVHIW